MNIILLEKIKKLGDIGDEVNVKSGYARNFLVPNKKALYATPENRKYFDEKKSDIKSQNDKLVINANKVSKELSGQEVILIRAASDSGQLFGSVSTKDIVKNLEEKKISIFKNQIDLNKSIKNLTFEKVSINLHPEVSCEITLNVARSMEEAIKQKEIGRAITSNVEVDDNNQNTDTKRNTTDQEKDVPLKASSEEDKKTSDDSKVSSKNTTDQEKDVPLKASSEEDKKTSQDVDDT
tara:strand:- start:2691 stop:3401 length:711 start_codon:yes stop_codon:yes gene_type:complete